MILALVGTMSGPFGSVVYPNLQGAQIWIKDINTRGGLNGHEVRSIVFDDGGDPARHRALVKEAVERYQAIAFLEMLGALTGSSSVDYIASKRVPVIGGDGGEFIYGSPMHFPQGSALPYLAQSLNPAVKAWGGGKNRIAVLTCTEAQVCNDADKVWGDTGAKAEGQEVVYRGKISLAQPDFTAECLNASNAKAEVILFAADGSTLQRAAASCARQNYRPKFATMSSVVVERFKDDPNLDGLIGTVPVFPWFQAGTPAVDEFQAAMRKFGPDIKLGVGQPVGWVAGKLLEKAAANLPEPPTSQAILEGLWSLKDEALGGLTSPLTFVREKPAPPTNCWFTIVLARNAWVSPDNFKPVCRPVSGR